MASKVIVSPLLEMLLQKLSSLISRKSWLLRVLNNDLEELSSILNTIKSVMGDAQGNRNKELAVRVWLIDLKDIAYDAEDLLEELELKAIQKESEFGNMSYIEQVSHSVSTCSDFMLFVFSLKIGKMKIVIRRFRKINARRLKLDLIAEGALREVEWLFTLDRETSSALTEPTVYGREREKENIIVTLLDNMNCSYDLSICPILGIAGVGKTTLAQLVYRDARIVENFNTRIWVCTSRDFGVEKITQVMINYLTERRCDIIDLDLKQKYLKELLVGQKVLLVIDDVWDDDSEKWNNIIRLLACVCKGSSIIVTTRLQTVVDRITSLSISCVNKLCELQSLHEDDAWSLFERYAFSSRERVCRNESLITIGMDIVRKCKGVPFAIKTVGRMLNNRDEENFWKVVRNGEIWDPEEHGELTIKSSLRLSYYHLPPIYKQCFVYCSIFPKGSEIEVEELIKLCMANGFVQTDGRMELEDLANEIFKKLVLESFFENMEENWLGIKTFKMQHFVHDLARVFGRTECVSLEDGDQLPTIPKSVRHLFISDCAQSSGIIETISKSFPQLRTCIFPPIDSPLLPIIFRSLTCLRALHLRGGNISNLPKSVENLKHLRYLNLSSSVDLQFLPQSICNLGYLQTLELSHCWKLQELPKYINKLINLRYLYMSDCRSLIQLPDGIGGLISLRHLHLSECDSLIQIPDAIRHLRSLRHLDLHDCEKFSQLPDVIGQLTNLTYLDISRCPNLNALPDGIAELVNLRRLNLSKLLELTHLPLLELNLCSNGGLSIRTLHGLNNLEGELQVRGLEHLKDGAEAKEANLVAKKNLSSLSLVWEDSLVNGTNNSEEVIQCLRPPRSLNKLVIEAYRGTVFPAWVKLLMHLVEIQLSGCSECRDLPPLGHLPLLRKLCIFGMHSLKCVNKEFYGITSGSEAGGTSDGEEFFTLPEELEFTGSHKSIDDEKEAGGTSQGKGFFPSLEELEFRELHNWEEWQVIDDEKVFLRLQKLRLDNCPNITLLPLTIRRLVQKFEITRCEKLMVN